MLTVLGVRDPAPRWSQPTSESRPIDWRPTGKVRLMTKHQCDQYNRINITLNDYRSIRPNYTDWCRNLFLSITTDRTKRRTSYRNGCLLWSRKMTIFVFRTNSSRPRNSTPFLDPTQDYGKVVRHVTRKSLTFVLSTFLLPKHQDTVN